MISPCPLCKGRPINNVMARFANGPCEFCAGCGTVDTDLMCKCGKPGVKKLNGIDICTRFECGKAALEKKT